MGLSAQVAFSSLLAFFPAMVFLVGLLDLIGAYETLQEFLAPVAPGDVLDTIDTLQRETSKGTSVVAFVVGAAGATWAASGAMNAVIKAVNRAYDRVETRPFWRTRIVAIVLVALMGLVLAGLLLLVIFGGPLGTAIADKAHLGGAFELLWTVLRWPIAFAAILLFFGLVYYLAPNVDVRSWKWLTPGSFVGSVAWLALSGLFALYTSFSDTYSKTYGALASGIVLLLWLNYSAFALLFGAELNSELERQAEIRAAGGEDAGLVKPSRRI
jgi:membrane protein